MSVDELPGGTSLSTTHFCFNFKLLSALNTFIKLVCVCDRETNKSLTHRMFQCDITVQLSVKKDSYTCNEGGAMTGKKPDPSTISSNPLPLPD